MTRNDFNLELSFIIQAIQFVPNTRIGIESRVDLNQKRNSPHLWIFGIFPKLRKDHRSNPSQFVSLCS